MKEYRTGPKAGFTLVELLAALAVAGVCLLGLAGVLIAGCHQREQSETRGRVLHEVESTFEKILGTAPDVVAATYHGKSLAVPSVTGANGNGSAITLTVSAGNPKLRVVTANCSWLVSGKVESFTLSTVIYNPKGV